MLGDTIFFVAITIFFITFILFFVTIFAHLFGLATKTFNQQLPDNISFQDRKIITKFFVFGNKEYDLTKQFFGNKDNYLAKYFFIAFILLFVVVFFLPIILMFVPPEFEMYVWPLIALLILALVARNSMELK